MDPPAAFDAVKFACWESVGFLFACRCQFGRLAHGQQPSDLPEDWCDPENPPKAWRSMTRFFQRGGVWVVGQAVLLTAVVLLAVCGYRSGFPIVVRIVGVALMIAGASVALAGAMALGRNLTPLPMPSAQACLVRHGIYAVIRHPLYTSVIAVAVGWALVWQSWPSLLVAAVLIPFFAAKARREERWLREMFPEYGEYEKRVRRFLPHVC